MAANKNKTVTKSTTPAAQVYSPAARSRINQKRRQRIARQVQRFEAVLPDLPLGGRVSTPHVPLQSMGGWLLRRRWFWLAALCLAGVCAVLTWAHTDERWFIYREDIHFNGLHYLTEDELWPLTQLDGWNVFWIDRGAVRQRLLQDPYVADAKVHVSALEGKATVDVTEAAPVALWMTDEATLWLRDDGTALQPKGEMPPGLLQILDGPAEATAPGVPLAAAIDVEVLRSAQGLANRLPGVAPLRYNRDVGLNFRLPGKPYWVYWGDSADVERKVENLAAGEKLLADGKLEGEIIDVRFERPYVK